MPRLKLFGSLPRRSGAVFTECESFSVSSRIDLTNGSTKQSIYAPEAGKNAAVVSAILRDFSGVPASAQVSLGWNAAADDFKSGLSVIDSDLAVSELGLPLVPEGEMTADLLRALAQVGTASQVFGAKVSDPEGGAMSCAVDVFGYLY